MQLQVNADNHTAGSADLTSQVESTLESALPRFRERVTRWKVYLTDKNSSQWTGESDMRCVLEASLTGLRPITVSAEGSSLEQALDDADDELEKTYKRIPGTIDRTTGQIQSCDLSDPEVVDIPDDLAQLVLRMKGDVVVVPVEWMPSTTGAAATFRYGSNLAPPLWRRKNGF